MVRRFHICILLLFFICPANLFGEENWKQLKTKHTVVFYGDENALDEFERKVKVGVTWGLFALSKDDKGLTIPLLQRKIDRIFESNQELLEVYDIQNRINIFLHSTQREVEQAYRDISKRHNIGPSGHQRHIAFYFHKEKAVHVSVEKVTEGVLAHELGHAILDHHHIVPLPKEVAERAAQYLEENLKRW